MEVSKSEFKIIETYSGFIVERLFEIHKNKWFLIWIYKTVIYKEFKRIDINGNRSVYVNRINSYINKPIPYFESFEQANAFIDELIKKLNFVNKEYTF